MRRAWICVLLVGWATTAFGDELLVLTGAGNIRRYDSASGAFLGAIGNVFDPDGFDRAAGGTLYVGSFGFAQLNKLDSTGTNLQTTNFFARPEKLRLGPDGLLYVNKTDTSIARVDPGSLLQVGQVSATGAAGDMRFGPDGLLWTTSSGQINAFNVATNTQVDFDPAAPGTQPFATAFLPKALTFGPDGDLYVIDFRSILRFDPPTGANLGEFVPAPAIGDPSPVALTFGPDGNLYVARDDNKIARYNGQSGALMGIFIDDSSMDRPREMIFIPEPTTVSILMGIMLVSRRRCRI